MNKSVAAILAVAGAAMLQGCAYDPYAGTYAPATGYTGYGAYGYPAYGYSGSSSYPAYGYSGYGPSYSGLMTFGGGYRGGDWDHHRDEEHHEGEHRDGYRPEHRENGQPVNLSTNYHQPRPEGRYQQSTSSGGHSDHDHAHQGDRDDHH